MLQAECPAVHTPWEEGTDLLKKIGRKEYPYVLGLYISNIKEKSKTEHKGKQRTRGYKNV